MPSILQLEVTSLPLANLSGSRIAIDGPMTISDIPLPPGTALPSSIPIPVPPSSSGRVSLTSRMIDEVSPSNGESPVSGAFASNLHGSLQPLHPTTTSVTGPVSASQPAPSSEIPANRAHLEPPTQAHPQWPTQVPLPLHLQVLSYHHSPSFLHIQFNNKWLKTQPAPGEFYHLLQMKLYQVHPYFHTPKHATTSVLLQLEMTSLPLASLSRTLSHHPWTYL
ncbi:hypothetical protein M405DRAFT_541970 [Rhizopogon salebrosus TDB-379]|nr:hypothetical protein M405DRAFT_541970 [Rhizopogon salebrosus TDB-379]